MAKTLDDKKSLMFLGGGKSGKEPLIFQTNGSPYRGFLDGRINKNQYQLILRLSNMELKKVIIAIFFAIVIYNLVIFRDNVDINKQLDHIDTITVEIHDFMAQNKQFFNQTEAFINRFEKILDNLCHYDPKICA